MINLGALDSGDNSFAYSINSKGWVVGYSGDPDALDHANAFLWKPTVDNGSTGTMSNLGQLNGSAFNYARDINDAGQIVGWADSKSFITTFGQPLQDIGSLGGSSTQAWAINNLGMIIGNSKTPAAVQHAFIYADGGMRDLNDLVPAGGNWSLNIARGINDLGQVAGVGTFGGTLHGFLLSPLPTWKIDSDGTWSTGTNWLGGLPSGPGAEVRLTGAILAPRTVTLDTHRTVGHLVFDNSNRYTLAGATLTINGAAANTGIEVRSGGHTISAPVNFASTATISLAMNSSLQISGSMTGPIKSLQIGTNATMDLTSNSLLVNYDAADGSPIAVVAGKIGSAFNGGSWNGTGLTSSTVAAIAADSSNPHKTALGYAEAGAIGLTGAGIDATTLYIRSTLQGDSNLDGKVNAIDFNALAAGFGATSKQWLDGDFNYDGNVTSADFAALAGNFGSTFAPAQSLGTLVPEPAMLSYLACTAIVARRRRSASGRAK
jgi:probable HAF family extracellular repeat protein